MTSHTAHEADGSPSTTLPTVVHVIHGLGSGVEAVVLDYVRATPEYDHHVVYSVDPTCHAPGWGGAMFAGSHEVGGQPLDFVREVRGVLSRVRPDVVHAHSSVAGLVTRLVPLRTPVVYTPHCFAFLRRDISRPVRGAIWLVEAVLARRTCTLAACSPHEAQLARRFMSGSRIVYVPNVAPVRADRDMRIGERAVTSGTLRVVTSGRVSPQKDPRAFAEIASRAQQAGLDVSFTWVGSGDESLEAPLRAAGVQITGWLSREEAESRLAEGDLYLHSALWEAAPLTVLEAAEAGLPVLARRTDALDALGLRHLWNDPEEVVSVLRGGRRSHVFAELVADSQAVRERHSAPEQRRCILEAYRHAMSRGAR